MTLEEVLGELSWKADLMQLFALWLHTQDVEFPRDKLNGNWDDVNPGTRLSFHKDGGYDDGVVFTLPGFQKKGIEDAFVQFQDRWRVLKHCVILADRVEIMA